MQSTTNDHSKMSYTPTSGTSTSIRRQSTDMGVADSQGHRTSNEDRHRPCYRYVKFESGVPCKTLRIPFYGASIDNHNDFAIDTVLSNIIASWPNPNEPLDMKDVTVITADEAYKLAVQDGKKRRSKEAWSPSRVDHISDCAMIEDLDVTRISKKTIPDTKVSICKLLTVAKTQINERDQRGQKDQRPQCEPIGDKERQRRLEEISRKISIENALKKSREQAELQAKLDAKKKSLVDTSTLRSTSSLPGTSAATASSSTEAGPPSTEAALPSTGAGTTVQPAVTSVQQQLQKLQTNKTSAAVWLVHKKEQPDSPIKQPQQQQIKKNPTSIIPVAQITGAAAKSKPIGRPMNNSERAKEIMRIAYQQQLQQKQEMEQLRQQQEKQQDQLPKADQKADSATSEAASTAKPVQNVQAPGKPIKIVVKMPPPSSTKPTPVSNASSADRDIPASIKQTDAPVSKTAQKKNSPAASTKKPKTLVQSSIAEGLRSRSRTPGTPASSTRSSQQKTLTPKAATPVAPSSGKAGRRQESSLTPMSTKSPEEPKSADTSLKQSKKLQRTRVSEAEKLLSMDFGPKEGGLLADIDAGLGYTRRRIPVLEPEPAAQTTPSRRVSGGKTNSKKAEDEKDEEEDEEEFEEEEEEEDEEEEEEYDDEDDEDYEQPLTKKQKLEVAARKNRRQPARAATRGSETTPVLERPVRAAKAAGVAALKKQSEKQKNTVPQTKSLASKKTLYPNLQLVSTPNFNVRRTNIIFHQTGPGGHIMQGQLEPKKVVRGPDGKPGVFTEDRGFVPVTLMTGPPPPALLALLRAPNQTPAVVSSVKPSAVEPSAVEPSAVKPSYDKISLREMTVQEFLSENSQKCERAVFEVVSSEMKKNNPEKDLIEIKKEAWICTSKLVRGSSTKRHPLIPRSERDPISGCLVRCASQENLSAPTDLKNDFDAVSRSRSMKRHVPRKRRSTVPTTERERNEDATLNVYVYVPPKSRMITSAADFRPSPPPKTLTPKQAERKAKTDLRNERENKTRKEIYEEITSKLGFPIPEGQEEEIEKHLEQIRKATEKSGKTEFRLELSLSGQPIKLMNPELLKKLASKAMEQSQENAQQTIVEDDDIIEIPQSEIQAQGKRKKRPHSRSPSNSSPRKREINLNAVIDSVINGEGSTEVPTPNIQAIRRLQNDHRPRGSPAPLLYPQIGKEIPSTSGPPPPNQMKYSQMTDRQKNKKVTMPYLLNLQQIQMQQNQLQQQNLQKQFWNHQMMLNQQQNNLQTMIDQRQRGFPVQYTKSQSPASSGSPAPILEAESPQPVDEPEEVPQQETAFAPTATTILPPTPTALACMTPVNMRAPLSTPSPLLVHPTIPAQRVIPISPASVPIPISTYAQQFVPRRTTPAPAQPMVPAPAPAPATIPKMAASSSAAASRLTTPVPAMAPTTAPMATHHFSPSPHEEQKRGSNPPSGLPPKPDMYEKIEVADTELFLPDNKTADYRKWKTLDLLTWLDKFCPAEEYPDLHELVKKEQLDGYFVDDVVHTESVRRELSIPFGHWRKIRHHAATVLNQYRKDKYEQQLREYNEQVEKLRDSALRF